MGKNRSTGGFLRVSRNGHKQVEGGNVISGAVSLRLFFIFGKFQWTIIVIAPLYIHTVNLYQKFNYDNDVFKSFACDSRQRRFFDRKRGGLLFLMFDLRRKQTHNRCFVEIKPLTVNESGKTASHAYFSHKL